MSHPAGAPVPPERGGPPAPGWRVPGGAAPGAPGFPPAAPPAGPAACVRHPDRATALTCTRCERPACPECLREASVGHQCVDCVAQGRRGVRRGVTVAGAAPGARPAVAAALIATNVAVFAWTALSAQSVLANARAPLFRAWGLVPVAVADGEWWRLVTSGFLHFGPVHLVFNMMALWVIGRDVEAALGHGRFLAVYLVSLLGGSAAVMLLTAPGANVAGASGAVFGLMGGLAVLLRRLRFPLGQVGGLIVANLVVTFLVPGISVAGHLGGLATGAAATAALLHAPPQRRVPVQAAALAGLAVLLLAAVLLRVASLGPV
ncbi:MAG TPA: rhomboid family intramembrane serine protease [Pseudonocardia sp.]